MARTRDRRPSTEAEEVHPPAQANRYENRRVYAENELSAAEALMGINASPTASHPGEARSMSTSTASNITPPYLMSISQKQEKEVERTRSNGRASTTPSVSSKGRRRNRGKSENADEEEVKHVEYVATSVQDNSGAGGSHAELTQEQKHRQSGEERLERRASTSQVPSYVAEQKQQEQDDLNHIEQREDTPKMPTKSKRKRKRDASTSIQINGTDVSSESNGQHNTARDGHSRALAHTQLDIPAAFPSDAMYVPDQQTQNEVGGSANPTADSIADESNGRKSKPRNFDKVVFGRWVMKTWYHSPYPISNIEDDSASVSVGPSKLSASASATRGRASKSGSARNRPRNQNAQEGQTTAEESNLWVCDKCFKYMQEGSLFELHSRLCKQMCPPGKKVYERGAHVIYEIDGAKHKLYCQNLSLFGKFFIDIKTLFYDCENFMFYVLTEGDRQQDHVIGFFSKEKVSYDEYNLACIIAFPPYQRKRYGMLMIEFSYYLSRKEGKLGTPERPLSELGLRTYLTYWTGALAQFFRRVLSVQPLSDFPKHDQRPVHDDLIRFIEPREANGTRKRRKSGKANNDNSTKARIWESGLENEYNTKDAVAATSGANDVLYNRMRWTRTSANSDGSATTHVFARCTLQDIANATGIRMEDIAFTLHECGLLQTIQALDKEEAEEVIVVSREMVEQIAQEFKVKSKMCMEVGYCLV